MADHDAGEGRGGQQLLEPQMPSKSRWLVGSSRNSRSGAAASSRAMARRRFQPPESELGAHASPSVKPARPRRLVDARGALQVVEVVVGDGAGDHFVRRCGRHRIPPPAARSPTRVLRRMEIDAGIGLRAGRPGFAAGWTCRRRCGPIRPSRSPSEMPSEMFSNSRREPKDLERPVQLASSAIIRTAALPPDRVAPPSPPARRRRRRPPPPRR